MKSVLKTILLSALLLCLQAWGQGFPNKPVRIICPTGVGSSPDIVARQLGKQLSAIWGQSVVVENVTGAGGEVALQNTARAPADGYTVLMIVVNHTIGRALYTNSQIDLAKDFKHVAKLSSSPLVFVAGTGFAPNNLRELIALAKAKPGSIDYGSAGNGSVTQLAVEMLKSQTGTKMNHIPYKGTPQLMTDLMGNQIPLAAPGLATALPAIKAGRAKVLAVTTRKRSSAIPDIPTVEEQGVPGFDVSSWNGLSVPAGTPDAIVEKLYADVAKVVNSQEFIDQLKLQTIDADLEAPAVFKKFISEDVERWAKLVKESGAKLD